MKKIIIGLVMVLLFVVALGCSSQTTTEETTEPQDTSDSTDSTEDLDSTQDSDAQENDAEETDSDDTQAATNDETEEEQLEVQRKSAPAPSWKNMQLVNVNTGESFTLDQFDTTVMIKSFAVWCPKCAKQHKEIAAYNQEYGKDAVVFVSLNTDPNEDEEKVKQYVQANGFDWFYAVAPVEMTQELVDEFGTSILNPPSVPKIFLCTDGSTRFHKGALNPSQLQHEIEAGCA